LARNASAQSPFFCFSFFFLFLFLSFFFCKRARHARARVFATRTQSVIRNGRFLIATIRGGRQVLTTATAQVITGAYYSAWAFPSRWNRESFNRTKLEKRAKECCSSARFNPCGQSLKFFRNSKEPPLSSSLQLTIPPDCRTQGSPPRVNIRFVSGKGSRVSLVAKMPGAGWRWKYFQRHLSCERRWISSSASITYYWSHFAHTRTHAHDSNPPRIRTNASINYNTAASLSLSLSLAFLIARFAGNDEFLVTLSPFHVRTRARDARERDGRKWNCSSKAVKRKYNAHIDILHADGDGSNYEVKYSKIAKYMPQRIRECAYYNISLIRKYFTLFDELIRSPARASPQNYRALQLRNHDVIESWKSLRQIWLIWG